ncbi:MAG: VWA domain-containing protein [Vampirovibrionales bacterium]
MMAWVALPGSEIRLMGLEWLAPHWLWGLLLLPTLAWLLLVAQHRHLHDRFAFSQIGLVRQLKTTGLVWRQRWLPLLGLILLALVCVGLAQPRLTVMAPTKSSVMMVLFDISVSMEATDMEPNRLEAAKTTARDFIRQLPADVKVGLLFFAANSYVVSSPLDNRQQAIHALDSLEPGHLKEGTALGDALMVGYDTLNGAWQKLTQTGPDTPNTAPASPGQETTAPHSGKKPLTASMVLVTDGENNIGVSPHLAAMQLKQANVSVFTIGIGEDTGAFVRQNIYTRLDEAALRHISGLTDGQYYRARTLADFQPIYAAITEKTLGMARQEWAGEQLILGVMGVLLLAGCGVLIIKRWF